MSFKSAVNRKLKNLKKAVASIGRRESEDQKPKRADLQAALDQAGQNIERVTEKYETCQEQLESCKRFLMQENAELRNQLHDAEIEKDKLITIEQNYKEELKSKDNLLKEYKDTFDNLHIEYNDEKVNNTNDMNDDDDNSTENFNELLQDADSLRAVIEIKQDEIKKLRATLDTAEIKKYELDITLKKLDSYKMKCEDLEEQLHRRYERERGLIKENSKLRKACLQESINSKRLSYQNKELQWRMRADRSAELEKRIGVRQTRLEESIGEAAFMNFENV